MVSSAFEENQTEKCWLCYTYEMNSNWVQAATTSSRLVEVVVPIICGLHVFKLTYLLRLVCNPNQHLQQLHIHWQIRAQWQKGKMELTSHGQTR